MELLYILLIFLFIWFILVPAIKVGLFVRKQQRAYRQAFDRFNRATSGFSSSQDGNSARTRATHKAKKIDPSVGEYVDFEEIKVAKTATTGHAQQAKTQSTASTESRIEDVQWEDIP